ncbi:hypothetical protein CCMA1212_000351 [Trichoderma ghanense]|uniref:Uncharacterized protein n=1 Tax=Trichoderma ghanense TaxID=65468 RepID=A0ABY2HHG8_9HYPO
MAAADAIQSIAAAEKRVMTEEYGGKLSNMFVEELKSATLFKTNWGELLSAAPTALYFMGSCWLAAANPMAEMISLADVMPEKGFTYMTNIKKPTLRACLVDVCNNGGRQAFTIAGQNMDALHMTSRRICDERIVMVFKRLGPCTSSEDALEDFNDALEDLSRDAQRCAKLASETREGFAKWGKMVGELQMCMEAQAGNTAIRANAAATEERAAEIEMKFAVQSSEQARSSVMRAAEKLKKSEDELNVAIQKVPGPWKTAALGAFVCYTQTIPTMVAGAIFGGRKEDKGTNERGHTRRFWQKKVPPTLDDPCYASATAIRDLVNHFYNFLGNDNGPIDWEKFKDHSGESDVEHQGVGYLLGTLKGQQQSTDRTGSDDNKKLMEAYGSLTKVCLDIQTHLSQQHQINAEVNPSKEVVKGWKKKVSEARDTVLSLAGRASAMSSSSSPIPFGCHNTQGVSPDASARNAQLSSAMQLVQMRQATADSAQSTYEIAVAKQNTTAIAMARVQAKLREVQETGQNLAKIKEVLRECISVLVDLVIQISKLEEFFIMLANVIDNIILPRAETFKREMSKLGGRARKYGTINPDDITKQTIYTSTLQLKGYFSVLQDISGMYTHVHQQYITTGVDLCYRLSKGTASNNPMPELQHQLASYSETSAKAIIDLATQKQNEIRSSLRVRARKALEHTQVIESEVAKRGIPIEHSAKAAIKEGGEEHDADAESIVNNDVGLTASEQIDCSSY